MKFYSHEKKYGFIQREGHPDLFFHQSSIIGEKMPERSQEVSFEIIETDRGLQAIKVRSVEPAKYKKKGD
ncbi:cold shock domain-containing protein [Dehalococcoidia bacterium]|nr:cold shock domain-containing protein [Dehalococcoidia bacterium]